MVFVFYILWFLALGKVLLGPTIRLATRFIFVLLIGVGIWIILGGITYQTRYSEYLTNKSAFDSKKKHFVESELKLQQIAEVHPTSRDALLRLAYIAYQVGDHQKLLKYIDTLRRVDPNDTTVQTLLRSIQ